MCQLKGSLWSGHSTTHGSTKSAKRGIRLEEGDIITGVVDITHEHAHMIPAIRVDPREKEALVSTHLPLDDAWL